MKRSDQWRKKIDSEVVRFSDSPEKFRWFNPLCFLWIAMQIGRKWIADRGLQNSAILAFQTVVSFVPLIAAALLVPYCRDALSKNIAAFNFLQAYGVTIDSKEISSWLSGFSIHVHSATIWLVAAVALALTFLLFLLLEKIFNQIWNATTSRSMVNKLIVFYPLATILPLSVGLVFFYKNKVLAAGTFTNAAAPMLAVFVALIIAIKLLPNTHVGFRSATIGAFLTTVLVTLLNFSFSFCSHAWLSHETIGLLGPLGIIPLVLIWIFSLWFAMILGSEAAYVVENLALLRNQATAASTIAIEPVDVFTKTNGRVAARLMLEVVQHFAAGNKALPKDILASRFDLSLAVVDRIFVRLKECDLALEVCCDGVTGYLPARPLGKLQVKEVLDAFAGSDIKRLEQPIDDLDRVLRDIREVQERFLSEVTFADLVNNLSSPTPAVDLFMKTPHPDYHEELTTAALEKPTTGPQQIIITKKKLARDDTEQFKRLENNGQKEPTPPSSAVRSDLTPRSALATKPMKRPDEVPI